MSVPDTNSWCLVQDTAWVGYEEIPTDIMRGYLTQAHEITEQIKDNKIDIIFLQSHQMAFGTAFLWNDRFVMTAADKLHFSCGSAAAVGACDIWCSYIDQQFA